MPQFDADRDAGRGARARSRRRDMLIVGRSGRGGGASPRARGGRGARLSRPPRASIPTRRGWPTRRSTTSCAGWRATSASWPSARSASTSTTTTRRGTSSARSSGGRSGWPGTSACPSSSTPARPTTRRPTLLEEERAERRGVIHCFTGGHELARRALALGFYISFSGIVAFPRAEVIQEVARTMPLDRLLVETDAPVPGPAAPSRQAQRAGVRGRGGPQGGRAAWHPRSRRWPRRPPPTSGASGLRSLDNAGRIRQLTRAIVGSTLGVLRARPSRGAVPGRHRGARAWPRARSTS